MSKSLAPHGYTDLLPQLELAATGKLTATHSAVLSPSTRLCGIANGRNNCLILAIGWSAIRLRQNVSTVDVLPLLHRGRLVRRMDAKMHRKEAVLEVIALYLENGVKPGRMLENGLLTAIGDFARWQGAQRVTFGKLPEGLFIEHRQGLEMTQPEP